MALSINDLGLVLEEVYDTCRKWYEVGLMLRVPVVELDNIDHQYVDKHDKLLQTLKIWLRSAEKPTWQSIVSVLKSRVVGEQELASRIETQYHIAETGPGQIDEEVTRKGGQTQIKQQLTDVQQLSQLPTMQKKPIPVLIWQTSETPNEFSGGTAVSDGQMAYFNCGGSTSVYAYNSQSQEWSRLPDCLPFYSCLAIVQGMLTTIGGTLRAKYTNFLLSLTGEGTNRKWCQVFPLMPTGRRYPAAICSGRALIVAGGACGRDILDTVEVLDTDTMQWSIASSLPDSLTFATAAVCGDRLYLLGGNDYSFLSMTCTVFTSSIPELLKSCRSAAKQTIWRRIADVPLYHSTCANLCGWLVAVGGRNESNECTTAIHVYDETTDSWQAQQGMPTARENALVAMFPGSMLVVGGVALKSAEGILRKVDIATFL